MEIHPVNDFPNNTVLSGIAVMDSTGSAGVSYINMNNTASDAGALNNSQQMMNNQQRQKVMSKRANDTKIQIIDGAAPESNTFFQGLDRTIYRRMRRNRNASTVNAA